MADEVALGLRGDGHDVEQVRHALAATASDADIWDYSLRAARIVVTCNRDHFLALAKESISRGEEFPGLLILKQRRASARELGNARDLIGRAGEGGLRGNINFA